MRQSSEALRIFPFFRLPHVAWCGKTLMRQSTEFMLHYTDFYVKVTPRSTEAVLDVLHLMFLRES